MQVFTGGVPLGGSWRIILGILWGILWGILQGILWGILRGILRGILAGILRGISGGCSGASSGGFHPLGDPSEVVASFRWVVAASHITFDRVGSFPKNQADCHAKPDTTRPHHIQPNPTRRNLTPSHPTTLTTSPDNRPHQTLRDRIRPDQTPPGRSRPDQLRLWGEGGHTGRWVGHWDSLTDSFCPPHPLWLAPLSPGVTLQGTAYLKLNPSSETPPLKHRFLPTILDDTNTKLHIFQAWSI
jgi:hypothetical protein